MAEKYEYVTKEDVRKACRELGLADWSALESPKVSDADAEKIRKLVGGETLEIPLEEFTRGLEVELEHGTQFADANVTNNHPVLTGRIVLAHLKEGLDYYLRLECMELEMELAKAVSAKNAEKSAKFARQLAENRMKLEASIASRLG